MGDSTLETAPQSMRAPISQFYSSGAWIEGRAEDQLKHTASWSGVLAIAAFPDLHPGRHGPVAAAILADRLYPQLIGPDIGCGMTLVRLSTPRSKLKLDKAVRRLAELDAAPPEIDARAILAEAQLPLDKTEGLGAIGGGNHFCELQSVAATTTATTPVQKGELCLLVHSGSRGFGASVFQQIEERWAEGFDPCGETGRAYLALHDQANRWASANRRLIAQRAAQALRSDFELVCDSPHNLLEATNEGWLHRKGAAKPDQGLAPLAGSRETPSYLLAATPSDEALRSLSHGAGRRYDRASMHGRLKKTKSALQSLSQNRYGGRVVCADPNLMIEEAGAAYKSAAAVADDLERFGLAKRMAELTPLLTFKTARNEGGRR